MYKIVFLTIVFFFFTGSPTLHSTDCVMQLNQKNIQNDTVVKHSAIDTMTFAEELIKRRYRKLNDSSLNFKAFSCAMKGYSNMLAKSMINKNNFLTIVDYSQTSCKERFFVIDLLRDTIIYKCLAAHGKNSGNEYADSFSNQSGSNKSSLGFFQTAETYKGKQGFCLRLNGIEANINDNARWRGIVIHSANYVSERFVRQCGRLGRSLGCIALPNELNREIINKIKGKTCLFVYAKNEKYLKKSDYLKPTALQ